VHFLCWPIFLIQLVSILITAVVSDRITATNIKDAIESIESVAKIVALIVGGVWAWKGYIRKRIKFPSAKIEHIIRSWRDADRVFIRVTVRITNNGNVIVAIREGCSWLEQITPLPDRVRSVINDGKDPTQEGRCDVEWQLLQERKLSAADAIEIEPNEHDDLHFDFALDASIQRVLVYSRIENPQKTFGERKIGWNLSTIYDIETAEESMSERAAVDEQGSQKIKPAHSGEGQHKDDLQGQQKQRPTLPDSNQGK
jgi:hypothetical protein